MGDQTVEAQPPNSALSDPVLLTSCHGSVERVEDVPAFLTKIRRGRPVPEALVWEVSRRLTQIGGSPLWRITEAQTAGVASRLNWQGAACARLWHPFPSEVLASLQAQGVTRVLSLPLAPQSVEVYHEAVREAALPLGIEVLACPPYGEDSAFVEAQSLHILTAIEAARRSPSWSNRWGLVLTAHSLPQRIVDAGDRYGVQVAAMATAVETHLRTQWDAPTQPEAVRLAFQSAGADGGAWLGPMLDDVLVELRGQGVESLVLAPIGFVSDHVETLYDLDIATAQRTVELGFRSFHRVPALNDDPRFLDALAGIARRCVNHKH